MRVIPLLVVAALFASALRADVGPGLGNVAYQSDQVFSPIGFIESGDGHGNVTFVQGYLMVIVSSDGGGSPDDGAIEFWDVSDPSLPVLVVRHDNADTHGLREAHGFSLSWSGASLVLAAQGINGVQLYDVTDPLAITLLGSLDLPGIEEGDYSGDWWIFWQAPWLYVAGVDSGLYVVDARDPAAPSLAAHLPTGELAGVSPAQVFALGNLLVLLEVQSRGIATLDISSPTEPRLLRRVDGKLGYSHVLAADGKILTSGSIPPRVHVHSLTHAGNVTHDDTFGLWFNSGGYGSYQDGFFHSGFSIEYAKVDLAAGEEVGSGSSGRDDRDEDFATVLGNLVFAGDDHGTGTALIVHQAAPDTSAPVVEWTHPEDGATALLPTSRFGLSLSDHIDAASVTAETLWLENTAAGTRVEAVRSAQLGLVNLAPVEPLLVATTYKLVAEGIKDVAGNASARFEASFTTGDGSVGPAPDEVITQLSSNSVVGGSYAVGTFMAGAAVYTDRDFAFSDEHPARFFGQPYILTANNDKVSVSQDFLSFELTVPAEVFVLYDTRATSLPSWLESFTPTGETAASNDTTFDVFVSSREVGSVTLGGNNTFGGTGADSMYSVVVRPAPLPCDLALSPSLVGTVALHSGGPSDATFDWQVGDTTLLDAGPSPSVALAAGRHGVIVTVRKGVQQSVCSGVQIVHRPLLAEPARMTTTLLWQGERTFNVNPDNGSVTAVDAASGAKLWETLVGTRPVSLATAPDGRLWVVDGEESKLSVLDANSGALLDTFALPRASSPFGLVFSPAGLAHLTLEATGEVVTLDAQGTLLGRAFVTKSARGLTWHAGKLYVSRFLSPDERGELYVVNAETLEVERVIPLVYDEGPDTEASGRGVPNYLTSLHVSPDGALGFVLAKKDNTARGLFRDGQPLTFESRVRAMVAVIDLVAGEELLERRLDVNDRDLVQSATVSPYGDLLFLAAQGNSVVDVFETESSSRVTQLHVGKAPRGIALSPSGDKLAVYGFLDRAVSFYAAAELLDGRGNSLPELVVVGTVANERLSDEVLRGKRVFYDASDRRMSKDGYLSCASCHLDGGHDGRTWDFSQAGEGLRNTIPLVGRAGTAHGDVHWTANFDEIQDFEHDIRGAFGGDGFLSDEDFALTNDPLGTPKAGRSADLDALATYVASLERVPDSPFRRDDGGYTPAARRGREVFVAKQCQACHAGAAFTDVSRHDVGTASEGSGLGLGQPLAGVGFETPTLKGVWQSAPYLHDGSAPTLSDVLSRHGDIPPLSDDEATDLVAYLEQLDESSAAAELDCADVGECVDEAAHDGGPSVGEGEGEGEDELSDAGDGANAAPSGCGCSQGEPGALWPWMLALLLFGSRTGRSRRREGQR